ncbi:MAG: hypothetical protein ACR2QO_02435 [Acidimicrobiales bacterium]
MATGSAVQRRLIELVGLPGSGKSSLGSAMMASESLHEIGVVPIERLVYRGLGRSGRLRFQANAHVRHRQLATTGYRMCVGASHAHVAGARLVPGLLVDTERLRHAERQLADGEVGVFAQGPIQQLRSLITIGGDRSNTRLDTAVAEIEAAVASSTRWTIVALDVASEVASARIAGRASNSGRYDRMDPDHRREVLTSEALAQDKILAVLNRLEGCDVLRIDGEMRPGAALSAVETGLRSVVQGAPSR